MSRAFVKERDEPELRPTAAPERRPITAAGHAALRARLAAESDPARHAELAAILADVYVEPPPKNRARVAFGATVRVRGTDETGAERSFTLVGEDEIDVERGRIGVASPLGQALLGKRAGATARWTRPAGARTVTVVAVAYD